MKISYITSAVDPSGYPLPNKPEVAIAGRSNAGKSSLINALTNAKVAKVSQTPGKTRLLNFFDVGEHYRFVDMPGYGYAARGGNEQAGWQKIIEEYLFDREPLVGLILVMDARREWTDDEAMLVRTLSHRGLPTLVALTKADKVSRSESLQRMNKIKKVSGTSLVFLISSLKKTGVKELEDFLFEDWIKPRLNKF